MLSWPPHFTPRPSSLHGGHLRRGHLSLLLLLLVLGIAPDTQAMSVSPILTDLTSTGSSNRSTITVVNTGVTPLPVEVNVNLMELKENGERELTPNDEDFLIFPPQAMVPSGASQVFRVQWAGDPDLAQSRSYAFLVNQIPIEPQDGGTVLELIYSVVVYVNVSPIEGESDLRLVRVAPTSESDGGRKVELVVENRGNHHDYLSRDRILLKAASGGWSREIRSSEFASSIGIGLVQPGHTRRFVLPVAPPADAATLTAELSNDDAR